MEKKTMRRKGNLFSLIPYYIWIFCFVIAPILLVFYYSLLDLHGHFTFENYRNFFTSVYLKMTLSSFWYAFLITLFSLLVSYPAAYLITKTKHKQLWLILIIIPSWINLLLKTYAFIGIFGNKGPINAFVKAIGLPNQQILFTDFAFVFVSVYIFIPFMILPIFNSLDKLNPALIDASRDLGASKLTTLRRVIIPLTMNGIKAGVQAVFIPSLSLFMITRLIAGNRVITLGTSIEEQFLTTQNWGMGSTIAVFLIIFMFIIMLITGEKRKGAARNGKAK
ncbi:ABC transporter permease [Rummeliibacillus pycnus]|uniref:ABC transporter permease n=1 Tax=Rummeliibacillus pycnus TaxID=101070 RepID=UPI00389A180B